MWQSLLLSMMLQVPAAGEGDDPPLVGQPAHFWGAVGQSFAVTLHAPATATVDEPFTLTLRVRASGPWRRPPTRPRLEEIRGYADRFRIDRSASATPDREMPTPVPHWTTDRRRRPPRPLHIRETPAEQRTWEFDYRLRPRSEGVDSIPALPFAYYRPPRDPALPGSFPTTFADALPLKVAAPVVATPPPVALEAPDSMWKIVTGPAVARTDSVFRLPGLPWIVVLVLGPPLLALGWYLSWQRLYPDQVRLARRRQSRAARAALAELRQVPEEAVEQARRTAAITTEYLHARFGLTSLAPTPAEVGECIQPIQPKLAEQAMALYEACDAAQFAPDGHAGAVNFAATAQELIRELEAALER